MRTVNERTRMNGSRKSLERRSAVALGTLLDDFVLEVFRLACSFLKVADIGGGGNEGTLSVVVVIVNECEIID